MNQWLQKRKKKWNFQALDTSLSRSALVVAYFRCLLAIVQYSNDNFCIETSTRARSKMSWKVSIWKCWTRNVRDIRCEVNVDENMLANETKLVATVFFLKKSRFQPNRICYFKWFLENFSTTYFKYFRNSHSICRNSMRIATSSSVWWHLIFNPIGGRAVQSREHWFNVWSSHYRLCPICRNVRSCSFVASLCFLLSHISLYLYHLGHWLCSVLY